MFTLYRIVKRSITESVLDGASVHTSSAAFEAVSAPEQYCSAPLLKVERSVSDRSLSDDIYIICWGNLSLSKIIDGGGGGTPHRRILLFCKIVYKIF